jgi:protein arginine N-methyltransferase 1
MYNLYHYGSMIASAVRTGAYREALRRSVKPGMVVADIGTGTGIWAMLACRLGARKVYAIEADSVIEVARETACLNGFGDRIEFIQDFSTRVTLPERADVIVSDIRGVLPVHETSLEAIVDARRRLLEPGGVMIPLRDTLWAAVVESPQLYEPYVAPWDEDVLGFQAPNIRRRVTSLWRKAPLTPEELVTEPVCWAVLEYDKLESRDLSGAASWTVQRAGVGHGLALWFDTALVDGVGFSNAPDQPEVIYGRAFFPWQEPVALAAGDTVSASLRANFVGGEYIWRWECRVEGKAHFRQSSFDGTTLSLKQFLKRAVNYRPSLSAAGEAERFVLSRMDGKASVEEIAAGLWAHLPGHFQSLEEATSLVGEIAERCGA